MWGRYLAFGLAVMTFTGAHVAAIAAQPTSGVSAQSSDELYATWESNNRTNHEVARQAGKNFVTQFPSDSRAPRVQAWIAAYERVVASHTSPVPPSGNTTLPQANSEGPTLDEAKAAVANFASGTHPEWEVKLEVVARVDGCTLVEEFTSLRKETNPTFDFETKRNVESVRKLKGIKAVDLSKVDLGSIKTNSNRVLFSSIDGRRDFAAIRYFVEGKEIDAQEVLKRFNLNDWAGNALSIYAQDQSTETAVRLTRAFKDVARGCGAKVSAY